METIIGWIVPLLGLPLSWYFFNEADKKTPARKLFYSALCSFVVMVVFVFVAVFAIGACIELHVCENLGDAGFLYTFNSFFIMPIYFLIIISKGKIKNA